MPKNPTRADLERAKPQWSADFKALNPALTGATTAPAAPCGAFPAQKAPLPPKSPLAAKFEALWTQFGGPELTPEYRFDKTRRWRFDYALPRHLVAIELEGGIHKRKGHASPEGYIKDCRKYNAAAGDGWWVFRLASGMMNEEDVGQVVAAVKRRVKISEALESFS